MAVARTTSRPFQFRVRTALVLMLIFGVGGGLWMRYQNQRKEILRRQMAEVERLRPLMKAQTEVASKILNQFYADLFDDGIGIHSSAVGSSAASRIGTLRGLEWDAKCELLPKLRIQVGSSLTPHGQQPILIQTNALPDYESAVNECVKELQAAFEKRGWESEVVSAERWLNKGFQRRTEAESD